jgi:hypothetical protein
MSVPSEVIGIHQSDIIIRSAIIAALDDLRANPWLLDHVFASLPKDSLTRAEYGQREIDAAKKWFMSTRIPVFMTSRIDDPVLPCITISLVESNEAETTLGDTHYLPRQDDDRNWPALSPAFTPVSYDQATGTLEVPATVGDALVLAPGQQILDRTGRAHEILEVLSDYRVLIAPGAVVDFESSVIKGKPPSSVACIESVKMKETYALGCHVQGEQTHLTYLHTILVFCLYRYKARLLEARGFERSVVSSSDFRRNEAFENELTFSRHLNLGGFVTQVWPGDISPKVTASTLQALTISAAGNLPGDTDPDDALWIGDQDALTVKF